MQVVALGNQGDQNPQKEQVLEETRGDDLKSIFKAIKEGIKWSCTFRIPTGRTMI